MNLGHTDGIVKPGVLAAAPSASLGLNDGEKSNPLRIFNLLAEVLIWSVSRNCVGLAWGRDYKGSPLPALHVGSV